MNKNLTATLDDEKNRKKAIIDLERDFRVLLVDKNLSTARALADEMVKEGFFTIEGVRSEIYNTIIKANWSRQYKIRTISRFKGEPYNMQEYRDLI